MLPRRTNGLARYASWIFGANWANTLSCVSSVVRLARIGRIAAVPAEGPPGGALDALGVDAAGAQLAQVGVGEVLADDADDTNAASRDEGGGERGVRGGAAEDAAVFARGHVEVVERDRADDEK